MTTIWIDASFAIEWLGGTQRAKRVSLGKSKLKILTAQYAEVLCYFERRTDTLEMIEEQLEPLLLTSPSKSTMCAAACLYNAARKKKNKASLADAILAAAAIEKNESIASFDEDFKALGLKKKTFGLWMP